MEIILLYNISYFQEQLWYQTLNICVFSSFNRVQLFLTPWTIAHQAPLSMGFFTLGCKLYREIWMQNINILTDYFPIIGFKKKTPFLLNYKN